MTEAAENMSVGATSRLILEQLPTIGFELAIDPVETATQLRLTGRVHKARIPTWMLAIETLCVGALGAPWTIDISQHHFVMKPMAELVASGAEPINGSHVRFGWRIIMQASADVGGIRAHYEAIAALMAKVQPPRLEVMQVSLSAPPDRNRLVRGKGATPLSASGASGPRR